MNTRRYVSPGHERRRIESFPFQLQAAEKKRPKDEKDIIHRLRPFARLQTAEDYEVFCTDILCKSQATLLNPISDPPLDEAMLRKRIAELQGYRKVGLTTAADIKKWEEDFIKRVGTVSL